MMTDRIREIIAQTDLRYNEHQNVQWRKEELARLITQVVNECCDIMMELRTRPADLAVRDIKQHFGMK